MKLNMFIPTDGGDPLLPWCLHDSCRTLATAFPHLGIRFEVTPAVLDYVEASRSGTAGIYQRHDWGKKKRDACQLWSDHISEVGNRSSAPT